MAKSTKTSAAIAPVQAAPRPVRVIEDWSRVVRPVDLFTEDGFAEYARSVK
ncbi:hypothetical protein [Synechococcus elongatus]|uniref:hypothetical protein n=1 Tax=Synechococcus elongatus TaxID=32046 RepID=UPI001374F950|nr:hypothetical protein [Synechococcus elongatus]